MIDAFADVKEDIMSIPDVEANPRRVWSGKNFLEFLRWTGHALKTTLSDRKILLFAGMQVVAITMAYYLWVQMLGWIPDSVWHNDAKLMNIALNLALLAWSFLCVGLATGPVAIFTGCMAASHFLKKQGFPSTLGSCFRMVLPRAWSLWAFFWIDGWFTVNQILERLPKKGPFTDTQTKILKELLYYAWKLGTVGILPALLNGKNLFLAGKESVLLVRNKTREVMLLRGGYSLFCWIVGVLTYAGVFVMALMHPEMFHTRNPVYTVYFWSGIPILIAVTVIQLFLRPIFVLGSCELYTENIVSEQINPAFKTPPPAAYSMLVGFGLLMMVTAAIYLYREPLGLMKVLELRNQTAATTEPASPEPRQEAAEAPEAQAGVAAAVESAADCVKKTIRVVGSSVEEVCADE